jgi:AraC-like DNA-binding protein
MNIEYSQAKQKISHIPKGHEVRLSDSPYIEKIGRLQAGRDYMSACSADVHWNMLLVRYEDKTSLSVWEPMTQAMPMNYLEGAEFLYITFRLGSFMPHLPIQNLLDTGETLPIVNENRFWLKDAAWQFPDYENVETFVEWLVREEQLVHEPLVDKVMQELPQAIPSRTVRHRFLRATGLTQSYIRQIERAQQASQMLEAGYSILDTVYHAGYADQPHLTRALKRFIGLTPMQIRQQE